MNGVGRAVPKALDVGVHLPFLLPFLRDGREPGRGPPHIDCQLRGVFCTAKQSTRRSEYTAATDTDLLIMGAKRSPAS